jgi:hypothetical protein
MAKNFFSQIGYRASVAANFVEPRIIYSGDQNLLGSSSVKSNAYSGDERKI